MRKIGNLEKFDQIFRYRFCNLILIFGIWRLLKLFLTFPSFTTGLEKRRVVEKRRVEKKSRKKGKQKKGKLLQGE
jgi:hypothetical protein